MRETDQEYEQAVIEAERDADRILLRLTRAAEWERDRKLKALKAAMKK